MSASAQPSRQRSVALARRLAVAPMMDWTDRHCRYFLRLCAPNSLLYTEMINARAIGRGDAARLLRFDPLEHPVALQLGGSHPDELAAAAAVGEAAGYDEINLNVGCPSGRVQAGRFGVCLMREPALVAECVQAMRAAVDVPVTVKTRIGVDNDDSLAFLQDFVGTVADAGCSTLIIHARKAWLHGLSPKENRNVPPLDYERVRALKKIFSHLEIIVNGGLASQDQIKRQLRWADGVMIGREAYRNPWWLAVLDAELFAQPPPATRSDLIRRYLPYVRSQLAEGEPLASMTRHVLGLFQGQPGARAWRRQLSERAHLPGSGADLMLEALPTGT